MLKTLDGSIISLVVLSLILFNTYDRSFKILSQHKTFTYMVLLNMLLIVIDLLTWYFNGRPGPWALAGAGLSNDLLFILEPLAPALGAIYINNVFGSDEMKLKRIKTVICFMFSVNAGFALISLSSGWYFIIDAQNVYRRGDLFFIHSTLCMLPFFYSILFICKNRADFQKKDFYTLLFYFVPITAGIVIQLMYYGYSSIWSGLMISLLIIYFNIQSRGLNTDYLTGINNRRYLDEYITYKIRKSTKEKTFAAVMIDIDNFKSINDRFGHDVGDDALKNSARIIKNSLNREDFVARYGGDEFIAIIDSPAGGAAGNPVDRLLRDVDLFNQNSKKPYRLSFSIGYALYDCRSKIRANDLINYVDTLMYRDKRAKTDPGN